MLLGYAKVLYVYIYVGVPCVVDEERLYCMTGYAKFNVDDGNCILGGTLSGWKKVLLCDRYALWPG